MPETYACVPANFDPAAHLDPHLIEYADCARYLLDTVFRKWTTYHARPTDPVPLKADRLRAYFNPDYRMFPLVRDSLVARGVLECDYRYEVGGKCYGYRLAEPFRTRHVRVELTRKPLVRKIARDRRIAWEGVSDPVHLHLRDHLARLEIAPEAHEVARDLDLARKRDLGNHRNAASRIADRDFHFAVCDYGRVHTNASNLSSRLRPYLRYEGEPLVQLDVRNSQPLMLCLVLNDLMAGKPKSQVREVAKAKNYIDLKRLQMMSRP